MVQPTIIDAPNFDKEADCNALRAAMKGMGTDEKAIISILCRRSIEQRKELESYFKQSFGRNLKDDLKSELSGKFESLILALFMNNAEYDAHILKKAIKGLGTDETAIIEIMCTRTNAEMKLIKEAYKKKFEKDLEKDLSGDTSGDFKRFLVSMTAGDREDEGSLDQEKAEKEAKQLYEAGANQAGTDEERFNMIFARRSFDQLKETFRFYKHKHNKDICDVISSEFSGSIESALSATAKTAVFGREVYFADQLVKSMEGLGTNDEQLMRLVISRAEVDLDTIGEIFLKKNKKSLSAWIEDDTTGDYKLALMTLARGNNH